MAKIFFKYFNNDQTHLFAKETQFILTKRYT